MSTPDPKPKTQNSPTQDELQLKTQNPKPKTSGPKPSVLLVYHFFYPDDVVSAVHYAQFAQELNKRGWAVTVLTSNRYCRYPDKKIDQKEEMWEGIRIIRSYRPGLNQANKISRLINALWLFTAWIWKAFWLPKADVVVIGTDPQFAAMLFPKLWFFRQGKLKVHWCYDLYPEAIIADGAAWYLRIPLWFMSLIMRFSYKFVHVMVDIGSCMRKRLDKYKHKAEKVTLVPWALSEPAEVVSPSGNYRKKLYGDAKLILLYSGNMGRAHRYKGFIKLARSLYKLDKDIKICFSCRGNKAEEFKASLSEEDKNIILTSFVEESKLETHLNSADIHLASLREDWKGIVVPSKFFGSLASGRPVLYDGPEDSAIAEWIRKYDVGWVLSDENIEEYAEDLVEIANDKSKLEDIQKRAFNTYHKNFSKKTVMDQWDKILRERI